jgi:hypothetical protein
MCPPMADTVTDVRVVAAAEPGSLAEANAAVRPVSMPVVDRVASGVGAAVTPIRPDHREVLRVDEPPARLAGPPDPRDRGTVTGDLTALLWGGAARIFLMHHPTFGINSLCHLFFGKQDYHLARDPHLGRGRGTTPTTPSRPPTGTRPMVARSTSLHSSSSCWRSSGSPTTWCASARRGARVKP